MKFTKVLSLIVALLMVVLCFSACTTDVADDKQNDNTNVQDDANIENDNEPKVLKMGTNAEFPPYEYYENDKIIGIDAEIAAKIAEKLGMELVIEDMKFDSIITSVATGGVDMGMAGLTVTEERLESINFTSSYATGIQSVIVTENSDIVDLDGLVDKKIGVQLSTTGDIYASGDYGDENVVKFSKGADAVLALIGGDVDAVIIDNEPAKVFVAQNEGLKILDTEYAIEEYAIAVAQENTELLNNINAALEELIMDGTVDSIIAKYISAE